MEWVRDDRYQLALLRNRAAADEWALVLSAVGIDCRIEPRDGGWALSVASVDAEHAAATLSAYSTERAPAPVPVAAPPPVHRGGMIAGLAAAALLLLFHALTTVWLPARQWTTHGSAVATRILAGEWWRLVTALTLHADWSHVFNNTVSMALFATGVCRWFGPGVGLWLILAAGAGGNMINAYARGSGHIAVGASTAVFGAIGVLTTLQLSRRWTNRASGLMRMRVWAPVAAGLALLALLGSSQTSDVGAHFFGFMCGALLGFLANRWHAERAGGWLQGVLMLGVGAAIGGCWWIAL